MHRSVLVMLALAAWSRELGSTAGGNTDTWADTVDAFDITQHP